jgi:isopentenyl phosphate kinase
MRIQSKRTCLDPRLSGRLARLNMARVKFRLKCTHTQTQSKRNQGHNPSDLRIVHGAGEHGAVAVEKGRLYDQWKIDVIKVWRTMEEWFEQVVGSIHQQLRMPFP